MIDDDKGLPADVATKVVDSFGDIFVGEMLWETGGGSLITAKNRQVVAAALLRFSKTVSALDSEFSDRERDLIHVAEEFRATTTKAKKKLEQQRGLVYIAHKWVSSAPRYVVSSYAWS